MTQASLLLQHPILKSHPTTAESQPFKRIRESGLDFRGTRASAGVHGLHPYPAMLHFLVVRKLIDDYSHEGATVLDPFLGSGVTAVECLIHNRNYAGFDINPLAVLISRVRTTPIDGHRIQKALSDLISRCEHASASPVEFHNINYWFHDDVIQKLSNLAETITAIEDDCLRDFFQVAFSETVRRVSRTRYNEFKLLRKKNDIEGISVAKTFRDVALKNTQMLTRFYRDHPPGARRLLLEERDITDGIPVEDGSVDLVVTSPPYGDSRTTVAYGQFSRLSLRWLGLEERVDKTSLGGKARDISHDLPSRVLDDFVGRIDERDPRRAREVFSFYFDLYRAIEIIAEKVTAGGYVCFVVGNRRVKGIELPTDKVSAEFFEHNGFEHVKTLVRAISNKRMPAQNSPSNIVGQKDFTMRYEYIVVLRKSPGR